ncbi:hypothetical protein [Moraxella bovis]|uniref:Phosphodiester glycosidase domain-containing protein n=1 Tax=Moraxella bovis TaxID=476 RepID=A0A1S9ZZK2_MORBO|nr:hypothetical protein [Moraxella bovis]AWY19331.1 hypothetical protein DQF64_01525 [Moraxella bovis]OOR88910.1 hypothetical protein B0182_08390 [Moraxella bovis]UYZ68241.1 hypothetical protein LP122_10875 [Moraxella bovis]UYZ73448.1 hypothetical protein LP105_01630 [Moraxella bovis]UYZ76041.1 hypothetical protein LP093_01515 [Moraxella bovis]
MSKIDYVFFKETGVHKVILKGKKVRMTPIVQYGIYLPDPFSSTVHRASSEKMGDFDVCINGQWYKINLGMDFIGPDLNEGLSILADDSIYGLPSPGLWSISQTLDYQWIVKEGDPTTQYHTGVGGLCPLIVNKLLYGEKNVYTKSDLKDVVSYGEPKPEHKRYLLQRSSKKFRQLNTLSKNSGKVGFGIKSNGHVVIFLEEDKTAKMSYYAFRDLFEGEGCIHAFACDGSDSVFLYLNKKWKVRAALHKDNTQTSGIGFRIDD